MKRSMLAIAGIVGSVAIGGAALAQDKMMKMMVGGEDQSVAAGTVITSEVMADENGWLVVHRTDGMKPGPVVGHAPLKKGANKDVVAILTEEVKKGDKLMLMLHSEKGGSKMGIFEYTLGAKEDGPVKVDGKLVMTVITAQ